MGFLGRILGKVDFSDQISPRGVTWLIANVEGIGTETLQFVEPGVSCSFSASMLIPNVLEEFRHPKLAVVFGLGRGHAFFRTSHLRRVLIRHRESLRDATSLAEAIRSEGFALKRVEYVSFE